MQNSNDFDGQEIQLTKFVTDLGADFCRRKEKIYALLGETKPTDWLK